MILHLQGVGWLLLSVQRFKSIQETRLHPKNPFIITTHSQIRIGQGEIQQL